MKKDFDCVAMKDEIQRTLLKEWEGLDDAQVIERIGQDLDRLTGPLADLRRRLHREGRRTPAENPPVHR